MYFYGFIIDVNVLANAIKSSQRSEWNCEQSEAASNILQHTWFKDKKGEEAAAAEAAEVNRRFEKYI